jgi:hypothetical protein
MKKFSQIALVGALAFAFAGAAMAQGAGGGGGSKTDESKPPVSPVEPKPHLPHLKHHKKAASEAGGTTLHKQDKASHLKGASAAAAASALGTNDKGAPH